MWLFEGSCVILSTDLFSVGLFGLNKTVPGARGPHRSGSSSWNTNTSACATAVLADGPKLNSTIDAVILEGMRADEKRTRFLCPSLEQKKTDKTKQKHVKARVSLSLWARLRAVTSGQPGYVSQLEILPVWKLLWLLCHVKLRLLWALLCIVTQMGQNETITSTALRLPHL